MRRLFRRVYAKANRCRDIGTAPDHRDYALKVRPDLAPHTGNAHGRDDIDKSRRLLCEHFYPLGGCRRDERYDVHPVLGSRILQLAPFLERHIGNDDAVYPRRCAAGEKASVSAMEDRI
ncbi:hypothetical protein SDC9_201384 [bioreactor metagenome]|uniref:Uncharacterized protein n=1 Tax=bioreactor metagenome TaxID=1076179 RepID=A0A645IQS2_9ZZZZ